MSVIDIRLGENFYDHYKTVALEKRLGIEASRSLTILWLWAARNRAYGILRNLNEESIESAAKWSGETGAFIKALTELRWLDVREDGTYELHEWRQHNQWAARKDDRADATRFSGMARNYPELYQQLKGQGATRITSEEYERLITEYHESEKNKSSSVFLRMHCESHAPAPAPTPLPFPVQKESAAEIFNETSEKPQTPGIETAPLAQTTYSAPKKPETLSIRPECLVETVQPEQPVYVVDFSNTATIKAGKTQAVKPASRAERPATQTVPDQASNAETPEHSQASDSPANLAAVIALWNEKLAPAGFPAVMMATSKRANLFSDRVKSLPEAASMGFWRDFLSRVRASEFLCEKRAKSGASWMTLDWVLREDHFTDILEGKYDNSRYANVNAAKKAEKKAAKQAAVQTSSASVQEASAPKPEAIALPAKTAELYAKIQERQEELECLQALDAPVDENGNCICTDEDGNELPDPEISLAEYLRLKFPEADEEELRTDYDGKVHEDYSDFPQRNSLMTAFEAEKACALCDGAEHCALPAQVKSAVRTNSFYPTAVLLTNQQGKKCVGIKTVKGKCFVCKHKCANSPVFEAVKGEKQTAPECTPLPARKPALRKSDTWEADEYEVDVARTQELILEQMRRAEEYMRAKAEDAE